jgi:hypothetical protein
LPFRILRQKSITSTNYSRKGFAGFGIMLVS